MKKIWILWGLWPLTTAEFYLALIKSLGCIKRPEIIIWSAPLEIEKEKKYIQGLWCREYYWDVLRLGVKTLNDAQVDFICIPCNTVHEFHEKLQSISCVPILHIVEEMIKHLKEKNIEKVLLLWTSQLIQQRLYQQFWEDTGIEFIVPQENEQRIIDEAIIKILNFPNRKKEQEERIIDAIRNYNNLPIVLGCTDLQGMFANKVCFDSIQVLGEKVINFTNK